MTGPDSEGQDVDPEGFTAAERAESLATAEAVFGTLPTSEQVARSKAGYRGAACWPPVVPSVGAVPVEVPEEPQAVPSSWAWSNVPDDAAFPSAYSYDVLRDTVIAAFNPPDDDVAEEALMTDTLDRVWQFVVAQPCICPPGAAEFEVDACERCQVLGRAADVKVER